MDSGPVSQYKADRDVRGVENANDEELQKSLADFTQHIARTQYVKNFTWMGRPIIQYPSDMFVMQELIWELCPAFVIETGMAFGGTAVFYASIMEVIGNGKVITVDVDIRKHNRDDIMWHRMKTRIEMVEGDSVDPKTIESVKYFMGQGNPISPVIVCLDSNHTHEHVLKELEVYSQFVSIGSYLVVFDTAIETVMKEKPVDRPWGPGNNPMTAVREWLKGNDNFVVDYELENRTLITGCPNGFLRRVR